MKVLPMLIACVALVVAGAAWLTRPEAGGAGEAAPAPAGTDGVLEARVAALEGEVAALRARLDAGAARGSTRPAPRPEPTTRQPAVAPSAEPADQPLTPAAPREDRGHVAPPAEVSARGPGAFEADEPFMRVGSRKGYTEAQEIVEELPESAARWTGRVGRALVLGDAETRALGEALDASVGPLQTLGRDYLEGRIDRDTLRRRFWTEWSVAADRVAAVLPASQAAQLRVLAEGALRDHEVLPSLVGSAPP